MAINKEVIKTIIAERQLSVATLEVMDRGVEFDDCCNYVLVGVRRAGKSYMMYADMQRHATSGSIEDCLYVNFEDERISMMSGEELGVVLDCYYEMFGGRRPRVYLDEIQNVSGWEKFVRRLADEKYRVMVTGSNAKMLSREIATTLGGRYVVREVYPFSFDEFLRYNGVVLGENWVYKQAVRLDVVRLMRTYLSGGGFAESFAMRDKREWMGSLYDKVLLGDVVARNNVRSLRIMQLLVRKLVESLMRPMSLTRLRNTIKSAGEDISMPSLKDYLGYLKEGYLIFSLTNYTMPLAERTMNEKYYFVDNGLLNNFLFREDSKLLENLVAITLFKRFGTGVFYYLKNIEVDFYVPEIGEAIQVAYSIGDESTREREVGALRKFAKAYGVEKLTIVTMEEEETLDGIDVVPIWKWLVVTK